MSKERRAVPIPRVIQPSDAGLGRFSLLQKWDGVVLKTDADTFTARLIDSHGILPNGEAVFSREELEPEEAIQIAPGATFVWTIGYRHKPSRERISYFYFRRLPPWSPQELDQARSKAQELTAAIGWK